MKRQIFGVGGNFFRGAWERPYLQEHLLSLAGKRSPQILYIGAANGDNPNEIERFYRDMNRHDCRPCHYSVFCPSTLDVVDYFMQFDILYVGGGATRNLVTLSRELGLDVAFHTAWDNGVVLSGTSAGAICWYEGCITDSFPEKLLPLAGFGILKGSHCTHYDARPDRPIEFERYLSNGDIPFPGIATDNDTAVHYIEDSLNEVVTQRSDALAYMLIESTEGGIVKEAINTRLLGPSKCFETD